VRGKERDRAGVGGMVNAFADCADDEFNALIESYKDAKHYTQGDFQAMGKDMVLT
jgi:hypothetical protein